VVLFERWKVLGPFGVLVVALLYAAAFAGSARCCDGEGSTLPAASRSYSRSR
jgi:hypothetical protein